MQTTLRPDKSLPIVPKSSGGMHASVHSKKNTWAPSATVPTQPERPLPQGARRATVPGLQEMSPSTAPSTHNDSHSLVATSPGDVGPPLPDYFTNTPVTLSPSPSLSLATSPPPNALPSRPPPMSLPNQDDQSIVNSSQAVIPTSSGMSENTLSKPLSHSGSESHNQDAMVNESTTNVPPITPDSSQDPTRPADNHTLDESTVPEKYHHTLDEPEVPEMSERRWKWKEFGRRLFSWCPAWLLWSLLGMVLSLVLGITLGFQLRVRDFTVPAGNETDPASGVQLSANLVDVDPVQKIMTIHWAVVYAACCEDYDIFFDQNLLISDSGANLSNNIPDKPVFSINGSLYNDTSFYGNIPFFPTKLFLSLGETHTGKSRTLQSYPFDHYATLIHMFAKVRRDGFNTSDLRPISIQSAEGIAAGFNTRLDPEFTVNDFAVAVYIDVSRGLVVRIYSIVIVVAIWLVTLTLLSATVSSVFLGRKMAKEVMVVPVATLFAFTQLRGTLPGAPTGFGAIVDFIGILPCLAILALCSVLLLAVFLFRNPEMDWRDKDARV